MRAYASAVRSCLIDHCTVLCTITPHCAVTPHRTEHVARQTKVYVHCKAGRGRSTTLVLCWLVSTGMGVDEAWSLVLGKRPQVCLAAAQWEAVRAFADDWARRCAAAALSD